MALGVESPHPIGVSKPVGWLKYVAFKDIYQLDAAMGFNHNCEFPIETKFT